MSLDDDMGLVSLLFSDPMFYERRVSRLKKLVKCIFFLESEWDVIDQGKTQVENRFAFRFILRMGIWHKKEIDSIYAIADAFVRMFCECFNAQSDVCSMR